MPNDPYVIGYIAGIFDGEGNLQLRYRGNMQAKVCIYNTNKHVIEWLSDQVPGSKIRRDTKRVEREGWLPCGIFSLYRARDVKIFLEAILPYLIVKKDAAITALAFFKEKFDI
jgi:hypothetical protein